MPSFHYFRCRCTVAVLPFRSYCCRCWWEWKCWKRRDEVTRTLIGCPPTAERQKIGFDPIATEPHLRHNGRWERQRRNGFFHVCNVILMALTEFLRNLRNGETVTEWWKPGIRIQCAVRETICRCSTEDIFSFVSCPSLLILDECSQPFSVFGTFEKQQCGDAICVNFGVYRVAPYVQGGPKK